MWPGFSFPSQFYALEFLRIFVHGKFSPGLNCLKDISVARRIHPWRWGHVSWHHLENDQKLNKKGKFFQLKVRSNIKFKTNRKLLRI